MVGVGGGRGYRHHLIPIGVAARKSSWAAYPWLCLCQKEGAFSLCQKEGAFSLCQKEGAFSLCQKEGAFSVCLHGAVFIDWVDKGAARGG